MLMNNRFVVPGSVDNITKFGSLKAALTTPGLKAGDVIQIEPGSSPGHIANADLPLLQNLTIQGDPAANVQSIPYFFLDDLVTIGATQAGLNLKHVEFDILNASILLNADATITDCRIKDDFAGTALDLQGTTAAVISDSYIVSANSASQSNELVTVDAPSGSHNRITNNQLVALTGKNIILLHYETDPAGTHDVVSHNTFLDNTGDSPVLEVANNANGLTIQDNTITNENPNGIAIQVDPKVQYLAVIDNTLFLPNAQSLAIGIDILPGAGVTPSSIVIARNHINTAGQGLGIVVRGEAPGADIYARVEDNDLRGNQIGVYILAGMGGPVNNIDLGGGSQGSSGGNDFRGTGVAINVSASQAQGPIQAQDNIFGVGDPTTVIIDHHVIPGAASVVATNPKMQRDDILGRAGQTGQWQLGVSNGTAFATSLLTAWNPSVTWVDVQTGDFFGNGQTDIVGRVLQSGQWWVGGYNGTEFKTSLWTTWNPNVTWVDVKVGDFTGDGKADIAGRVLQTGQWWVAQSTGSSFINALWGSWSTNISWVDVKVGDFTGRRYADIAGRDLKTGQWWVAQATGAAFLNSLWATWNPTVTWVDVKVGDFNGDGLSDIAGRVQQNGQWWVGLSTGTSFSATLWTTWALNVTWVDIKVGDFDGDGKDDIIGRVKENGQWWVGVSGGSSFSNSVWAIWNPGITWMDVQVGDFNGDGNADITGRVLQNGQWWTGLSDGNSFTTTLWATWPTNVTWVDVHAGHFD
jgi:hypothetical protein